MEGRLPCPSLPLQPPHPLLSEEDSEESEESDSNDSDSEVVSLDSSDTATRAVLSQQTSSENGGKWHPIAFFSKSLSPVEQNYEIHDKEMLAII